MAEHKKTAPAAAGRHRLPGRALPRRAAGARFPRSTPCSAPAKCPTSSRPSAAARRTAVGAAPVVRRTVSAARPGADARAPLHAPDRRRAAGSGTSTCPTYIYDADTPRLLATPRHYAYVKIAEGCDYKCAFCIIPKLRGHYRSRPIESIVHEARALAARGVKELLLISQDTTFYGIDRGERGALGAAAARAERGRRPRVDPPALPLSDDDRPTTRIDAMAECDKVVQVHRPAAPARLRRRAQAHEAARARARRYERAARPHPRRACPASRCAPPSSSASPARPRRTSTSCATSSRTVEFDHVGVFTYSHEEGTPAHALDDDVPAAVKRSGSSASCGSSSGLSRAPAGAHRRTDPRARGRPVDRPRAGAAGTAGGPGAGNRPRRVLTDCDPSEYPSGTFVDAEVVDAAGYDLIVRPVETATA